MAWTRHGHQIPGTALLDLRTRPPVVRCSEQKRCEQCLYDIRLLAPPSEIEKINSQNDEGA